MAYKDLKPKKCIFCGLKKKIKSKGKCFKCYYKEYRFKRKDRTNELAKERYHKNPKCREYHSNYSKAYRQRNKEIYRKADRKYKLKKLYNLSIEDYNKLFNEQKGLCVICGCDLNKLIRKPSVDHDHSNGNVRGILCLDCNTRIGIFERELDWIIKVLNYIKN